MGATVLSDVKQTMECYQKEIFGPVFCIMTVDTLDEAIKIINENEYGNGTAVFTANGSTARKFQHEVEVGQIGINLPIPVPLPFFSWSGSKASFVGSDAFYGKKSIDFYSHIKTVTSAWKPGLSVASGAQVDMPTMK